jgi:uncharacterized protein CbrC (UPF0167 family)
MPEEMRSSLEGHAKQNGRSLNAEIIHRLEQSFADQQQDGTVPAADVRALQDKFSELSEEMHTFKKAYIEASEFIRELREMGEARKKTTGR